MQETSADLHIVHATTVHRWDDGRIFERQCRSLVRRGHRVTLVAPGTEDRIVDGVDVVAIGQSGSRVGRMTKLVSEVRRRVDAIAPDVVIVHDPELLRIAPIVGRRERICFVYDAHEDYAAQIRDKEWIAPSLRGVAAAVSGRAEAATCRWVDAVFCATPRIAQRFPGRRTTVVLNRPQVTDVPQLVDAPTPAEEAETARIVYVGDLRAIRGARPLVDAVGILNRTHAARLLIFGRLTPPALADELATSPGWQYVEMGGWRPRDELYDVMLTSHIATLPFLDAENHVESQPNKLFEYLLMGIPIVATDFPTWSAIADECGARFEGSSSGDAASIAAGMARVIDRPPTFEERQRVAQAARSRFSWEAIEQDYVEAVERTHSEAVRAR